MRLYQRESLQETDTKPLQTLGAPINNASIPIESPCKKQTQNLYKHEKRQQAMHIYQKRVMAKNRHKTPTNIGSTNKQCIYTNRECLQGTDTKPLQTIGASINNASIPIDSPCKKQTQILFKHEKRQQAMHIYQKRVMAKNRHKTPTNFRRTNKQCIYTNRECLQGTDTKPLQTIGASINNASIPIESPCKKQTQNPYTHWVHQ